jgi:hypothetical protein
MLTLAGAKLYLSKVCCPALPDNFYFMGNKISALLYYHIVINTVVVKWS